MLVPGKAYTLDQLVFYLGMLRTSLEHKISFKLYSPPKLYIAHLLVHIYSLSGGHVVGNFSPHEAFAIGGTNSVRGYEEGAVGSGRSYVVGSGEVSFPMVRLFS